MIVLLRLVVGLACAAALAGFAFILTVGRGLALSYRSGAGAAMLVRDALTVGVPVLLLAMLVSVFTPHARAYLFIVAGGVLLAMAGCAMLLPENPGEGSLYLAFFALWGVYFGMTLSGPGL